MRAKSPGSTRGVFSVVGYRFGPTLRQRRGGYVALVVLIGLIGGLSLASIAGARRTQLIALGALALAIVVSVIPGRVAGRTPTAVLLRTD